MEASAVTYVFASASAGAGMKDKRIFQTNVRDQTNHSALEETSMKLRIPAGLPLANPATRYGDVRVKDEFVPDERYLSRPSEDVQRKLQSALPSSHIPISSLHVHRLIRR